MSLWSQVPSRSGHRCPPVVAVLVLLAGLTACGPVRGYAGRLPAVPVARADAKALLADHLMVPVDGITPQQVSESFRAPRDGGGRTHHAVDLLAPRGTPVLATADGRVLRVSSNALGGRTVYTTDAAARFVFYYAHLDHYAADLRVGMAVRRGHVLGYVGTTGNAPANLPHLHFQILRNDAGRAYWRGTPIDPYPYLTETGRRERRHWWSR